MKEKYFINARIIDPSQNLDEIGGLIVDENVHFFLNFEKKCFFGVEKKIGIAAM